MMFAELIEVAGRSSNFASLRMRTQTIERTFLLIPMMRYRIISPLLLTASLVPSRRTRYLRSAQTVIAGRPRVAVNGYIDDNMESRCAFSGGGSGCKTDERCRRGCAAAQERARGGDPPDARRGAAERTRGAGPHGNRRGRFLAHPQQLGSQALHHRPADGDHQPPRLPYRGERKAAAIRRR